MKTEQEQIEAATMAIAREVCPYYNRGRCDLGSPTCHKTSIQLCSRKEAIIDSLNRIVKQAKIDVLNELKTRHDNDYEHCEDCSKAEIEETQYQKLGSQIKVLKTRLNNKYVEVEQLQKQLKQVQVEAQCKILCKLKERLQKYIWQKNIPEVMFNQEIETLIFELINERDFNLRNTLKGE